MEGITIGVLLDTDLDYGIGVLEGVRDFARTQPGWRVLPLPQTQEGFLSRLVRSGDVQGLAGAFMSDRWIESRFPPSLPLVDTANLSQVTRVCAVTPDDAAIGRLAAAHFYELGWRRVGVVSERATYASQLRREGFLAFMRERNMDVFEPEGGDSFRHETAWESWVSGLRSETAVFCTSDHLARRFWTVCKGCGASVAERILLAGVGDSLAERVMAGLDLTSVALPARRVGSRAAACLARLLSGDGEVVSERVPVEEIVVRSSTARYASSDPVVARAMGLALQTLAQNPGVEEIAQRAGVSRRTLELRFCRAFGHGPACEIRARKLELAQRLLVETDLGVAEVARRCGCGSVQAFTTLFRRAVGHPPAEHRRAKTPNSQVWNTNNQSHGVRRILPI